MSQNKKILWGSPLPFYWLCDCLAMEEIFEYNGSIAQIAGWAQEMLGYNFIIVHCSYKMMVNVDALNRIYGKRITLYIAYTTYMKQQDIAQRPEAYDASVFKILPSRLLCLHLIPSLHQSILQSLQNSSSPNISAIILTYQHLPPMSYNPQTLSMSHTSTPIQFIQFQHQAFHQHSNYHLLTTALTIASHVTPLL